MSLTLAASAIIAAVIGGTATGVGAGLQGRALKAAQAEARAMEALRRKDEQALIAWKKREEELNRKEREDAAIWNKSQARQATKERAEDRGFQRRQTRFQNTMGMINNNAQMRSQVAGMLRRPTNAV